MWNGKMKAFTFSYDDGTDSDIRFLEIINKYGLKATFNLNGGMIRERKYCTKPWKVKEAVVNRMALEDQKVMYVGHEVAIHGYTHPHLELLSPEMMSYEIGADIQKLTEEFGYRPVGMAYPFGTYSDAVVDYISSQGIKYSRTVGGSHSFDFPTDPLRYVATCHHADEKLMELAKEFVEAKPEKPMLFCVWGHTCEFDALNNWDVLERLCEYIANREDVFYGTNAECLIK